MGSMELDHFPSLNMSQIMRSQWWIGVVHHFKQKLIALVLFANAIPYLCDDLAGVPE